MRWRPAWTRSTLGTDAVRIKEAIEEVDGPEGVVVLMDLGSAVLSAELALDLLEDPEVRDRVILSAAPLVEGLVVAAVAAAGGRAGRKEVAAEAQSALMGKAAHLSAPEVMSPPTRHADEQADVVAVFTVANRHGLHARPAARLVSEMRGLDAQVRLRNMTTGAGPVPAGSLSRVATLGALHGHRVQILASGRQAPEAVDHLLALAARQFDEPLETAVADEPPPASSAAGPLPASPGIAIGSVRKLTTAAVPVDDTPSATLPREGAGSSSRSPRCAARSSTCVFSRSGRGSHRSAITVPDTGQEWPAAQHAAQQLPSSASAAPL